MKTILLLQIRNTEDPMRLQEVECFRRKLGGPEHYRLGIHSLLYDRITPGLLGGVDAVMVGGSGDYGCVRNGHAWFHEALDLLLAVVKRGVPLFCSCWGHQALAMALGGEVVQAPENKELGTFSITLTEEGRRDPLFHGLPSPFAAQLGHKDQVSRLPADAVVLASSERTPVQSYRLAGRPVYATQFHPELDRTENLERAYGYAHSYKLSPESIRELEEAFQESPDTLGILPRFLKLYVGP
ncbi:MAG: type 1 glutamine amidotransferase [Armatimonadetes bacterium]|nr:type 1 glutamine amidotransferase [Armatimonadota bacterium]